MELKDYIKETITQITMGIKESQEELKDTGAVIVPKLTIARNERTIMSNDHTSSQQVNEIKFKVGITLGGEKGEKGGISVLTGFLSAGGQISNIESTQSVSSIEFTIPIVFPHGNNPEKKGLPPI